MGQYIKIFVLTLAISTLFAPPQTASADKLHPSSSRQQVTRPVRSKKLTDGLYLVVRSSETRKDVKPIASSESLLVNDGHLLEPGERQPISYVVLATKPFIPIILAAQPDKEKDSQGKPMLKLQLAPEQSGPLEEFTRTNTGGRLAIVIGGKIITVHKIREAIKGGRLQITRCTDHGCQAIFTELQNKTILKQK